MKTYYSETSVHYTNTDNFKDSEDYTAIIEAKNKKEAKEQAKENALSEFNQNFQDGTLTVCEIVVDSIYETSSDARCS